MTLPLSAWLAELVDRNGAPPSPTPSEVHAALACAPSSPCPEAEARGAALVATGAWEVEEDRGPPTSRPGRLAVDLALICYLTEEE